MGNTWAVDRWDKEPHTWLRHHHEASVKQLFPTCLDVICHPRMILIGAGSAVELRHCLDKPFQPQSDPPPPPDIHRYTRIHSHFFACETTWMPVRGVGLRTGQEGSQAKTAVPRVYTPTPPWTQDPPHTHTHTSTPTPTFHSISYNPGKFTLLCFECDSSSSPACDEPNSSGLPTHRVVSPSLLLILGLHCTQAEGLPASDMERHSAKSPQLQAWVVVT